MSVIDRVRNLAANVNPFKHHASDERHARKAAELHEYGNKILGHPNGLDNHFGRLAKLPTGLAGGGHPGGGILDSLLGGGGYHGAFDSVDVAHAPPIGSYGHAPNGPLRTLFNATLGAAAKHHSGPGSDLGSGFRDRYHIPSQDPLPPSGREWMDALEGGHLNRDVRKLAQHYGRSEHEIRRAIVKSAAFLADAEERGLVSPAGRKPYFEHALDLNITKQGGERIPVRVPR